MQSANGRRGTALLELLVAAVSLAILIVALIAVYRGQLLALRAADARITMKEDADVAIDFLVKEIRFAGARPAPYPPLGCPGLVIPAIAVVPACTSFERLTEATASSIELQYDALAGADGCPDGADERIRYSVVANQLVREANGATAVVADRLAVGGLRFLYFASGTPLAAPLTTLDRTRVTHVQVDVTAEVRNPNPNVGGVVQSSRSSMVALRNPPC